MVYRQIENAGVNPGIISQMMCYLSRNHNLVSNKQADTNDYNGCNHIENYFSWGRWQLFPNISSSASMVACKRITRW